MIKELVLNYSSFLKVTKKESQELFGLLNASDNQIFSAISFFLITPRIGTISPWSSKATEILKNCGLSFVERVEKGQYFSSLEKMVKLEHNNSSFKKS